MRGTRPLALTFPAMNLEGQMPADKKKAPFEGGL
jgi:hypothetical protein